MITCDATELTPPDLETVEALARLQLEANRLGFRVRLQNVPPDLADLLELCGLTQALRLGEALGDPLGGASGVDAGREPEHGEEPGGVQEEGDAGDPVA